MIGWFNSREQLNNNAFDQNITKDTIYQECLWSENRPVPCTLYPVLCTMLPITFKRCQYHTMDVEAESKIIELVRGRRCLYDKTHPGYKDTRGIRYNNWSEIGQIMFDEGFERYKGMYSQYLSPRVNIGCCLQYILVQLDPEKAKEQWDSVRERYMAAKRQLAACTASGAGQVKAAK